MKKILSIALCMAMLFTLCACGGKADAQTPTDGTPAPGAPQTLQVGFGREAIMPTVPTHLSGGSDANRIHTGVLDTLYVTCVAITDPAGNTVLIYTQDLQSTVGAVTDPVIASVANQTGVPKENILVAATHTHSAPTQQGSWPGVQEFRPIYTEGMVYAAKAAMADRSAALVQVGSTKADGYVFTRHYVMKDGSYAGNSYGDLQDLLIQKHTYDADTTIQLVKFVREGKKDVLMMNLGIHPTFNGSASLLNISADAPSTIRDHIEQNSNTLVAYFMAPAGDQVTDSRMASLKHGLDYKQYGQKVGQLVLEALPEMTAVTNGNIQLERFEHIGRCNHSGLDRLEEAKELYKVFQTEGYAASNPLAKQAGFESIYEVRAIVDRAALPETETIPLAAMTLGDLSFIFASFEMFGDTGRYIRENSPYENTFLITQAIDTHSYIPSDIGFEVGCYEAYASKFEQGTAKKIADAYISVLGQMKNKE